MLCGVDVPLPVVISKPLASGELDESGRGDPGVFPACAVACAQGPNVFTPD